MNKLFLSFLLLGFAFSEANAGIKCQCNYEQTSWGKGTNGKPVRVYSNTGGRYTPCLTFQNNPTCEAWGQEIGSMDRKYGATGLPTPPDLQCTQIGTC